MQRVLLHFVIDIGIGITNASDEFGSQFNNSHIYTINLSNIDFIDCA